MATKRGGICCAAINCSITSFNSQKISVFRFPKDATRCQKWRENTARSDLDCKSVEELNKQFRLCSRHFEDSQFTNIRHDRLIWNAIPTLFDDPNKPSGVTQKRRLIVIQPPKSKGSAKVSTNIPTEHRNSAETFSSSTLIANFIPSVSEQCNRGTDIPLGDSTRSLLGQATVGLRTIAETFTTSPASRDAHSSCTLPSEQPSSSLGQASDGMTSMQPRPPVKPLMPYKRYSQMISQSIMNSAQAHQQKLKVWEIGKIVGQMWKELSDEVKQLYVDEYESEKIQYAEALKVYNDSLEHQASIMAKKVIEEAARRSGAPPRKVIVIQRKKEDKVPPPVDQRVIVIQPMKEEDDMDDGRSVNHIAASGYQSNYNLNDEIFSDALVSDSCESKPQIRDNTFNVALMVKEGMKEEQNTVEQLQLTREVQKQPFENQMEEEARLSEVNEQDSENQISESFLHAKDSVALPPSAAAKPLERVHAESPSEVKREDC